MFDIYQNGKAVGKVNTKKEGMYLRLSCVCWPKSKGRYKMKLSCGETKIDLGLCVPVDNSYTLTARVPIKKLTESNLSFVLETDEKRNGLCVPIFQDRPFCHLDKLKAARYLHQNGQPVVIIDPIPGQQGSGQNQEHRNR